MNLEEFSNDTEKLNHASWFTIKNEMSQEDLVSLLSAVLTMPPTLKRTLLAWMSTVMKSESIILSQSVLTVRPLDATWDPNMADLTGDAVVISVEVDPVTVIVVLAVALVAAAAEVDLGTDTVADPHLLTDDDLLHLTLVADHDLDENTKNALTNFDTLT